MNIERVTESTQAGKDTHEHIGYRKAFAHACLQNPPYDGQCILDLFARTCPWGTIRNDLNSVFIEKGFTTHCYDALDLLKELPRDSVDIVLLDPLFSDRMNQDKYDWHDEVGPKSLYTNPKYMPDLGKEISRITRAGGVVVKAGFNSNPPASGFSFDRAYLSHYGASRNDVIYSVWIRTQTTLGV